MPLISALELFNHIVKTKQEKNKTLLEHPEGCNYFLHFVGGKGETVCGVQLAMKQDCQYTIKQYLEANDLDDRCFLFLHPGQFNDLGLSMKKCQAS
jgi:hypothetical protein